METIPDYSRDRWSNVQDLDSFFARVYHYHLKHGFTCIMLAEALKLLEFIFVVVFSTFLFYCVDYSVLFRIIVNGTAHGKYPSDAVLPANVCVAKINVVTWVCLLVAVIIWILLAVKKVYHLFQCWDIKLFFNTALEIDDRDLDKLTWQEIQRKVREVQLEQQMCIHKRDLSELDIYHRILRFENYMVAMVNKSLLPIRLHLPFIGEVVFLTKGLKYNIELLLFWGPWAPFENNCRLKEDYKKVGRRKDLAQLLSKRILWVGIANFVMSPLILLWQILNFSFTYAEVIKRKPGILSSRCWSLYGRLYLRHFNELDHELNARLNRAYTPASEYINIFTSPVMSILARHVACVAGEILAVLVILSLIDERVLMMRFVLTYITLLGAVVAVSSAVIPDEDLVRRPEKMLTAVVAHVHYLPDSWRGQAHTKRVCKEFSQLFYYKAVCLLQEMLSPVITPYILCCHLRSKSLDIVDFYRNFTVEVDGVGDVCSFAQMDVRRHGNPEWQASVTSPTEPQVPGPDGPMQPGMQAVDGKTELSLFHFILTNPEWQPPADAEHFIEALCTQFSNVVESISHGHAAAVAADSCVEMMPLFSAGAVQNTEASGERLAGLGDPVVPSRAICGGFSRAEGPIHSPNSLQQGFTTNSLGASMFGQRASTDPEMYDPELTAVDVSILHLYELHDQQVRRRGHRGTV